MTSTYDPANKPVNYSKNRLGQYPNNSNEIVKCDEFIRSFRDDDDNLLYMNQLTQIKNYQQNMLYIYCDDILKYKNDTEFVHNIENNTIRYIQMFSQCIDSILDKDIQQDKANIDTRAFTPHNVYQMHRESRFRATLHELKKQNNDFNIDIDSPFPAQLSRRYELYIIPPNFNDPIHIKKMRDIKSQYVGHLVSVRGVVTRVTDVQPLVQVVTYICQVCGYESYQTINDKTFQPLTVCPSPACKQNESIGKLHQQTRGSKFVRYQIVRLQELPHEVPVGHVPRSLTLRLEGEQTRTCKPGDNITVHGIYLPTPFTGFRAIRAGLTTETYMQVCGIENTKKSFKDVDLDQQSIDDIIQASKQDDIYEKLAQSIAPEIYGHLDIKKSLILLLCGGVTRSLSDGLKIRGDINVLLWYVATSNVHIVTSNTIYQLTNLINLVLLYITFYTVVIPV